jgi:acyl-coenzyme A thioesterase PaaI-like protein
MTEPFVDTDTAAAHLAISPRRLLDLVRGGDLPAHPLAQGRRRHVWRFKLSELERALCDREASATAHIEGRTYRGRQSQRAENGQ